MAAMAAMAAKIGNFSHEYDYTTMYELFVPVVQYLLKRRWYAVVTRYLNVLYRADSR